jgi:hypothetical protein
MFTDWVNLTGIHDVSNMPKKQATCFAHSPQIPSAQLRALLLVFESVYLINSPIWPDYPVDTTTIILKELDPRTVCSPAKRPSKLGKQGKRSLHFLVVLVEGGDALLFIAKTYSCWKLTFAPYYYRSTSIERMRAIVLIGVPQIMFIANF